jgi:hypothetical protein
MIPDMYMACITRQKMKKIARRIEKWNAPWTIEESKTLYEVLFDYAKKEQSECPLYAIENTHKYMGYG